RSAGAWAAGDQDLLVDRGRRSHDVRLRRQLLSGCDEEFEAHERSSRQLSAISFQPQRIIAGGVR
ncbi:MAG: hypothetical protein LAO22_18005, partial [Acidobacteriia bacterium]|nr:hypothetical protein [Terriglobia bacterium]